MTRDRPSDGYVKSSFSEGGGNCVLVRRREHEPSIFFRDSKYLRDVDNRPEDEPIVEMPAAAWDVFEASVLNRTAPGLACGCPGVERSVDGEVVLRGVDGTTLRFTAGEWTAFRSALAIGEFRLEATAA